MDLEQAKTFAQLGGATLFALVVWWELRQQRLERQADATATRAIIGELRDAVTALLERERLRFEDVTPPMGTAGVPSPGYRKPGTPVRGVDVVRVARRRNGDDEP